ncbi:unnamed protein product [Sphenostylis stenocarpa]|uniref:Uncharacterized protein n=1 Tax=Sphenostylis stenocarpa TaxID=92480 RepID=A0AA86SAG8_9FABA|nr:unnamed protein product [Sphenostylis stenocarpa]
MTCLAYLCRWKRVARARTASEGSDSPPVVAANAYTAAIATVLRAPPKDFRLVKQEWGEERVGMNSCVDMIVGKKGFEGIEGSGEVSNLLCGGRQVRKQAALTLRCMQALNMLNERRSKLELLKQAEEGCKAALKKETYYCEDPLGENPGNFGQQNSHGSHIKYSLRFGFFIEGSAEDVAASVLHSRTLSNSDLHSRDVSRCDNIEDDCSK